MLIFLLTCNVKNEYENNEILKGALCLQNICKCVEKRIKFEFIKENGQINKGFFFKNLETNYS